MAVVPIDGVPLPTQGILSYGYQRTRKHRHQGIDLHAPLGTPVRAAFAGTVTHVARRLTSGFSGYGRCCVVRGVGIWALYAHLDQVYPEVGDYMHAGQILGTVGRTCFSRDYPDKLCARPHLHFEVSPRPYPQPSEAPRIDPIAYLGDQWHPSIAFVAILATVVWPWLRRWARIG